MVGTGIWQETLKKGKNKKMYPVGPGIWLEK